MNTFFFSQDSETNSHLLNFNTPSLAQKLLLHKIQHAPHPEQRERDKKKRISQTLHSIGISETRDPSLLAATETSFPLHCNLRRSEKGKKEKNYCAERLLLKETVERKKASAIGSWNREKWRFRRRRANFRRGEARRRSLSGLERRRKKRTTQQQQRSSDRERERKRVLVGFENKYKKLNKKQKQLKMRTRNEGGRINNIWSCALTSYPTFW